MIRNAIISELKRQGIKPAQLVKELGINKGHLSTYLKKGTNISIDKLEAIMAYLNLTITNLVTAEVVRNGKTSTINNVINYQGYLVKVIKKGVGQIIEHKYYSCIDDVSVEDIYERYEDVYSFYVNNSLIAPTQFSVVLRDLGLDMNSDIRELIGTKAEQFLVKWGSNEGGLSVERFKEEDES